MVDCRAGIKEQNNDLITFLCYVWKMIKYLQELGKRICSHISGCLHILILQACQNKDYEKTSSELYL